MRRQWRIVTVALFSIFLCAGSWPVQRPSSHERALADAANRARKLRGLPSLKWDGALVIAARKHAACMASHGSVSHQLPGEPSLPARATQAGARFVWLAENVDQGQSIAAVQEQFMRSELHRANILDREMDSIGIGVALRKGQLFVVEEFSKAK